MYCAERGTTRTKEKLQEKEQVETALTSGRIGRFSVLRIILILISCYSLGTELLHNALSSDDRVLHQLPEFWR
jgi:hypothetical protein